MKKLIALSLVLIVLAGMVPASLAESKKDFVNTSWYVTSLNIPLVSDLQVSKDHPLLLKLLSGAVKFVPYESWLTLPSVIACCCVIDFHANGTYTTTCAVSSKGDADTINRTCEHGTWVYRDHLIILHSEDGNEYPLTFWKGTLSANYYGFGANFEKI